MYTAVFLFSREKSRARITSVVGSRGAWRSHLMPCFPCSFRNLADNTILYGRGNRTGFPLEPQVQSPW